MKSLIASFVVVFAFISSSVNALDVEALISSITNDPGRPDADKVRDSGRKPVMVLDFLGIEAGMTVIDLVAAAGYYSDVIAHVVGDNGKVYMQNSPASLSGERGARTAGAIDERLENRLSNVEQLIRDPDDLGLPDGSLDAAVMALEFHELYRSDNPNAAAELLAEVRRVLKVGGVLGIIEHAGHPAYDPGPLHRALESQVVADAQAAGFFVSASSSLLENPDDNRSATVFDGSIRGATDRFVLRLVKVR
jgi:predicted methyltransferase